MFYSGQLDQSQLAVFVVLSVITVFYNPTDFSDCLHWQFLLMVLHTLNQIWIAPFLLSTLVVFTDFSLLLVSCWTATAS